jgi:hypothetical protein
MKITVDIPERVLREIERRAAVEGIGINDLMIRFIELGLQVSDPTVGTASSQ